jgi:DNA-binding transcriptional ArsR family regulator
MKTIREEVFAIQERGGDAAAEASDIAERLGVKPSSVSGALSRLRRAGLVPPVKSAGVNGPTQNGRSLAEFKQAHDKNTIIPEKIKKALRELGAAWEYEVEFIKRSGVGHADLNTYRSLFEENFVYLKREGKKIWCGTAAFAQKIKELI